MSLETQMILGVIFGLAIIGAASVVESCVCAAVTFIRFVRDKQRGGK